MKTKKKIVEYYDFNEICKELGEFDEDVLNLLINIFENTLPGSEDCIQSLYLSDYYENSNIIKLFQFLGVENKEEFEELKFRFDY